MTNLFLINFAAADLVRTSICLPPTVVWDATETWILGVAGCKTVLFVENVAIVFTVLTLAFVAYDRSRALKYTKYGYSLGKARLKLTILWLLAVIMAFPEPVTLTTKQPKLEVSTVLFTQCAPQWSDEVDQIYVAVKAAFIYAVPVAFIVITYTKGKEIGFFTALPLNMHNL